MAGGKRRRNYSAEDVEQAVQAHREEGLSLRQASERFGVPKSTILDHMMDGHGTDIGRPPILTKEEELQLLEKIQILADWGFPLTGRDLCHFVKSYLDKRGVVSRFTNNLPKRRWVTLFLKRHPTFVFRKGNPIKRARAAVSREDVQEFFDNFLEASKGVPPENMFNCDETNFKDCAGTNKVLAKRGMKYVEVVQNTSHSATSVMFCGSATGEMLPPMVVYRAQNSYKAWEERGPKGTKYSCSKNGWFDGYQYEKWFFEVLLPNARKKKGKKLLVCDNLSCHISDNVIDACRQCF
jgi:hypothetical protein